jgi:hypothetical protein
MATTAAPYGLKPVKRLDGAPYAGATTEFLVDPTGNAANIYNGTIVYLSGGYVTPATDAGSAADPLVSVAGVFVGCEYENDMGQIVHSQYYPANAVNAKAKVVTDPQVLFQAQSSGSIAATEVGIEVGLDGATQTGSTFTGNSTNSVGAANDAGASLTVVEIVSTAGDAYTDVLVKINSGVHKFG